MMRFADVNDPSNFTELHSRCKIFKGYYDFGNIRQVDHNKECFVFGDNLLRRGNGGQACIRACLASFGIATKRSPGMQPLDFFRDNSPYHMKVIEAEIRRLITKMENNPDLIVYFPEHGLGTGLSDMPNKCPQLFEYMNLLIFNVFGVKYDSSSN